MIRQPFADIGSIQLSEELIKIAFSRASKIDVPLPRKTSPITKARRREEARIRTVGQALTDRLKKIVNEFPRIDDLHPFYRELTDVLVGAGRLKKSLGAINWAANIIENFTSKHATRARRARNPNDATNARRGLYGRVASIIEQISEELKFLKDARDKLRTLPSIDTTIITIVIAGYANVGKSTLVKEVSTAKPEIAAYPFTTKEVAVGHRDTRFGRCQVIDTPGLLDRPLGERNRIELQAIVALRCLAHSIVFIVDPSETCGYPLKNQINLYKEIGKEFHDIPIIRVLNKIDLANPTNIEEAKKALGEGVLEIIATEKIGVEEVFEEALKRAVERVEKPLKK